ncbi:Type III restriction-modification system methylation subunit [gamma proteobacterium IMCC1989]|nr:Type III restriction-modification system methylation subunit [gamma proteobacterium IMCC1989]
MGNKMKNVELEDGQSADIVSDNISKMKELFPDAFSEGGVNFDTLRQLLGDASVLDEGEEKYGLSWHGKKKARQIALTPSTGTLLPCPDESVDWDTTKNLFIEGDNLEVLKLLQKSYANKVKMIYIDPPYNTGKEFIYPDCFQENLDTYLKYTGQVDEEGMKFSSNTESTGRMHSNWLSMMYSRLKIARGLLKNDGILFVSIDDNEIANLTSICHDIFGEDHFLGCFVWKRRQNADSRNYSNVSPDHEYILAYAKTLDAQLKGKSIDTSKYKNPDNDPRGDWASIDLSGLATSDQRPNLHYDIVDPETGNSYPPNPNRGWSKSKDRVQKMIEEGQILFPAKPTGRPREKKFIADLQSSVTGVSTWLSSDISGFTTNGTREVSSLFGAKVFDFPKPVQLIKFFVDQLTSKDDIVMDFFAGSATTAQAVMEASAEDSNNRRFLCIQLPEPVGEKTEAFKQGFKTITELALERVKLAAKKIDNDDVDTGVKLLKLAGSSIQVWNPDRTDIEESLLSHEEHLVEGRTEQDVLYELLLKRGVDLTAPIETREMAGKNIYSIGYGVLFACLDESITKEQVEDIAQAIITWYGELAPSSDTHVFFRDSAFRDDVSKTNMAAILEQNGITHVRSL